MVDADEIDVHAAALVAEVEAYDYRFLRLVLNVAGVDEEAVIGWRFPVIDPQSGGQSLPESREIFAELDEDF